MSMVRRSLCAQSSGPAAGRGRIACLAVGLWLCLPVADILAAEPLRFTITADNRGSRGFATVLEQIAKVPGGAGAFMISVGDIDPAPVTRSQLDTAFGEAFPWYPVVGNHDVRAKAGKTTPNEMPYLRAYFEKNLKGKVNPGPEGTRETTYSFDAGDVHIAVINQYWNGKTQPDSDAAAPSSLVRPLRRWLKADLQGSRKPWKLVVGHEPIFPQPDQDWESGRHGVGVLQILSEAACKDFWSILQQEGVAAYICAHTHRYSRYQPEGSKVWQIDSAMARGGKDWKYDAFIVVTVDAKTLKFDTYRDLKERGKFEVTDSLSLKAEPAAPPPPSPPAKDPTG